MQKQLLKVFQEYLKTMKNPTGADFYKWICWNYPELKEKINKEQAKKFFK